MNIPKNNIFLYYIVKILSVPLRLASLVNFKDSNIWVLGSGNGHNFSDNSAALFEYVNLNNKEIQAIWLTHSSEVQKSLTEKGCRVYKIRSWNGIKFALKAKVLIMSHSFADVGIFSFIFPNNKKVQLWHGTPLKDLTNHSFLGLKKYIYLIFTIYVGKLYDLVVSDTNLNKQIYYRYFGINKDEFAITGQPRNDKLIKFVRSKSKKQKVILYAPTWREYDADFDYFSNYGFNPVEVDKRLVKSNTKLIIKMHHVCKYDYEAEFKKLGKLKNIEFTKAKNIADILPDADLLITDYSSVYIDYLLLQKPMVFAPFDYELYNDKRGFYYNYNNYTPGPKYRQWKDVIESSLQILDSGESHKHTKKRSSLTKKFHKYQDGKNSERVVNEIKKLIK